MRRRLVLYGIAVTVAVVIAFLIPFVVLVRSLAVDRALSAARQDAQSLAVVAAQDSGSLNAVVASLNAAGPNTSTVYWYDGTVVGAPSPETPAVRLARTGRAFTTEIPGGAEVLLPVEGESGLSVVRVFVPEEVMNQGVRAATVSLVALGVALVASAALVAGVIARRLAKPVTDAAAVAQELAAGHLDARVEPTGPPEVVELGNSLNQLGDRIGHLLAAEREFMADMSHRIRTPITALRLDVDAVADPEQARALASRVDDLASQVDAVIRAARGTTGEDAGRCDAAAVVRERAAYWSILADDQGRTLHVSTELLADGNPRRCMVDVPESELSAAIDVLVDNVFAHTDDNVAFSLSVTPWAAGTRVSVSDAGAGFPDEGLTQRGRSRSGSTGLGLDIARRCVESAGGEFIVTRSTSGGAEVRLDFPAIRD